jgi:DNA polymerase-3 subunit gamma/tau
VFNGNSLDVIEIDAASSGLVADVRQLTEMVQYSTAGDYRVCLIDEVHSMSREGFNALLKTLEEPPANTIFVLLTTEPHRILDTIVSRCMSFEFRKITVRDIVGRLEHIVASEGLSVEPEMLPLIAGRSDGGMRDAVMALDQCVRAGVFTAAGYQEMVGATDYAPGILEAVLEGDLAGAYEQVDAVVGVVGEPSVVISDLTKVLKDVVVLNAGGTVAAVGEELTARQRLAAKMPVAKAVGWMRVLWTVKTKVRLDESPVSLIYLATAMLGEVGKRPVAAKPDQRSQGPIGTAVEQQRRRLTLDEMRSMTA